MARRFRKAKDDHLHIRVEAAQLDRWRRAAKSEGTTLSSWVEVELEAAADAVLRGK